MASNGPKPRRRRAVRTVALITLGGFAHRYDPTYCSGIEISRGDAGKYKDLSIDASDTRAFPPGRICREYGLVAGPNGGSKYVPLGERVIPSTRDYLIALLVIALPLAISMGSRTRKRGKSGRSTVASLPVA
jgi:hypothetical protein